MAIDSRLKRVFEAVLGADATRPIDLHSNTDDVQGWDSHSFVAIVVGIESEFGVKLSTLEAIRMQSVRAIYDVLAEKGIVLAP